MAAHVAAFRDAVDIPIVADGDTGFGNALNLVRTIKLYERAGANAIQLARPNSPQALWPFENKSVVTKAKMVQKIKAAVDTRRAAGQVCKRSRSSPGQLSHAALADPRRAAQGRATQRVPPPGGRRQSVSSLSGERVACSGQRRATTLRWLASA